MWILNSVISLFIAFLTSKFNKGLITLSEENMK